MPEFDPLPAPGKLTFKFVYYGPAQSGKTLNLMRLHDSLRTDMKGEIMTLETQSDRTLFFDLLPLGFRAPSGLLIKFRLFTVPGQVQHDGTRKAVLSRTDGIVFVADSQRTQTLNNGESFQNLADNAARVGLDFDRTPLAVQFNKRDLTDILSEEEVHARWKNAPWPLSFACALTGEGTTNTFTDLLRQAYRRFNDEYKLQADHGVDEQMFVDGAIGRTG